MNTFWKFLSTEEAEVDSVIVLGALGFLALIVFTALGREPLPFASAVGIILAAVGGGKRMRDGAVAPAEPEEK